MQNSELFRRGVVLPLNQEAEDLLRVNDVEEETPVHYLEIEDQQEFDSLWRTGIFERINTRTNGLIDDYEEHFVDARFMADVIKSIEEARSAGKTNGREVERFFESLASMASEAASLGRPLLFVL